MNESSEVRCRRPQVTVGSEMMTLSVLPGISPVCWTEYLSRSNATIQLFLTQMSFETGNRIRRAFLQLTANEISICNAILVVNIRLQHMSINDHNAHKTL
jgi:hypothetical protein